MEDSADNVTPECSVVVYNTLYEHMKTNHELIKSDVKNYNWLATIINVW